MYQTVQAFQDLQAALAAHGRKLKLIRPADVITPDGVQDGTVTIQADVSEDAANLSIELTWPNSPAGKLQYGARVRFQLSAESAAGLSNAGLEARPSEVPDSAYANDAQRERNEEAWAMLHVRLADKNERYRAVWELLVPGDVGWVNVADDYIETTTVSYYGSCLEATIRRDSDKLSLLAAATLRGGPELDPAAVVKTIGWITAKLEVS